MSDVAITFDWKDVNQAASSRALGHNFNPVWWQSLGLLIGGLGFAWYFDWMVLKTEGLGGVLGFRNDCRDQAMNKAGRAVECSNANMDIRRDA